MPGPANQKRKRKSKNLKRKPATCQAPVKPVPPLAPPLPLLDTPFIYDPGNGPRVKDAKAFLASKFFSQPPAWDVPLCAEFAQQEVLEMIMTVLPEELSLILWYNKSRVSSRICPACQRLYHLGDKLPEHTVFNSPGPTPPSQQTNPRLLSEQEISGLCSPVCFILAAFNYPGAIKSAWGYMGDEMDDDASFNYPGAIKSAWGYMGDEMDDDAWNLLNAPVYGTNSSDLSQGLGMLVKMTRLHDLGLAQLCFSGDPRTDIGS